MEMSDWQLDFHVDGCGRFPAIYQINKKSRLDTTPNIRTFQISPSCTTVIMADVLETLKNECTSLSSSCNLLTIQTKSSRPAD